MKRERFGPLNRIADAEVVAAIEAAARGVGFQAWTAPDDDDHPAWAYVVVEGSFEDRNGCIAPMRAWCYFNLENHGFEPEMIPNLLSSS